MDAVLNWLWQGGVVVVVLRLMLFALERASANVRYVVCWTAALFVMTLPALPLLHSMPVLPDALRATPGDAIVSLPHAWWTSMLVVQAAWTLWASIHIVRFGVALLAIRRARARSHAFPSQAESVLPHWHRVRTDGRRATLVLSDSVTTAAVLGWGAPLIAVAPSLVSTLDADELDRVLIHEWAHVQRRDDLVNILQIVVRITAGWHPALWWIDRRLHVEREIACDEMTVAVTGSPKSYASCLMKLATLRRTPPAMRMAPAVFTASSLRARVIKIVSPQPSIAPAWSRTIAAAIVMALCVLCVPLGALKIVEATALALPSLSPAMLSTAQPRVAPIAVPTRPLDVLTDRSPLPTMSHESTAQSTTAEQPPPSSQSGSEPDARPAADAAKPGDVTPAAEGDAGSTAREPLPSVPISPPERSAVAAEPVQSPWSAAAAGGAAIGRKSKDAGVATAGFFTRFGRRVADSF